METQKRTKRNCTIDAVFSSCSLASEANLQLPDPALVSYYQEYNSRYIWIDKDIDITLFSEIKQIVNWNREDELNNVPVDKRKPIIVMIHSYGGELDSCFAFIDIMKLSKTPIYTVNINSALSAAALILIGGHKRYCLPLSVALIHNGSGTQMGNYEQVVAQTDNYKKIIKKMKENIIENTKIDKTILSKWNNKEVYLYAEDQLKYGLVDNIVSSMDDILFLKKDIQKEDE